VSRDPIGIWYGKLNYGSGYGHVSSNPLNFVDPFGLKSKNPCPNDWNLIASTMPPDDNDIREPIKKMQGISIALWKLLDTIWGEDRSVSFEWVEPSNFQRPTSCCGGAVSGSWSLYFEEATGWSFTGGIGGEIKETIEISGSASCSISSTRGISSSWNGSYEATPGKQRMLIGLVEKATLTTYYWYKAAWKPNWHTYNNWRRDFDQIPTIESIFTRRVSFAVCERDCDQSQTSGASTDSIGSCTSRSQANPSK